MVGLLNSELITSLMEAEPSTKALTEEVMGISRPKDFAFWLTANAVATPSTVVFLLKGMYVAEVGAPAAGGALVATLRCVASFWFVPFLQ